jgi:hypothetical protein
MYIKLTKVHLIYLYYNTDKGKKVFGGILAAFFLWVGSKKLQDYNNGKDAGISMVNINEINLRENSKLVRNRFVSKKLKT